MSIVMAPGLVNWLMVVLLYWLLVAAVGVRFERHLAVEFLVVIAILLYKLANLSLKFVPSKLMDLSLISAAAPSILLTGLDSLSVVMTLLTFGMSALTSLRPTRLNLLWEILKSYTSRISP